jgi:hypothetical protein
MEWELSVMNLTDETEELSAIQYHTPCPTILGYQNRPTNITHSEDGNGDIDRNRQFSTLDAAQPRKYKF